MAYWPEDEKPDISRGKRTGPVKQVKFVRFSGFLSWVLIILTGLLTDAASPSEFNIYVLDSKWGKSSDVFFRESYMIAAAIIAVATFLLILISLIIDSHYQNRKGDHFSYALLAGLIVDFGFLIYFLVYFLS